MYCDCSASVFEYEIVSQKITTPEFEFELRFPSSGDYEDSDEVYIPVVDIYLGASFKFHVGMSVSTSDGLDLDASGSASAYARIWVDTDPDFFRTDWERQKRTIGSIDIDVDTEENTACGTVSFGVSSAEVCV